MKEIFLDTSFIIALLGGDDIRHSAATVEWRRQKRMKPKIRVTEYIVLETINFLSSRNLRAEAIEAGSLLRDPVVVEYMTVSESLLDQGWQYFTRRPDKSFSLTDCVSFVVMKQLGLSHALTFDHHFEQAGFQILPKAKG